MQNIAKTEENTSISRSLDELENLADTGRQFYRVCRIPCAAGEQFILSTTIK